MSVEPNWSDPQMRAGYRVGYTEGARSTWDQISELARITRDVGALDYSLWSDEGLLDVFGAMWRRHGTEMEMVVVNSVRAEILRRMGGTK